MKKVWMYLVLTMVLTIGATAQSGDTDSHTATPAEITAATFTYIHPEPPSGMYPTHIFEIVWGTAPSTASINITPCMSGGTCATATTSTATTNQLITLSGLANNYVIVVSWTGTPGSVKVNITGGVTVSARKTGNGTYRVTASTSPANGCATYTNGNLDSTGSACGSGGGGASPATNASLGTVQLASGQSSTTLSTVATTGSYNDLGSKPTLGSAAAQNTTAFDAAGAAATVQTNLTSEASTARAAESTNATAISTETTNRSSALTSEATARTSADSTNASAITSEAATARAAENTNATAITSEATTARAAESTNATAISTETSNRTTAVAALVGSIATANGITGTVTSGVATITLGAIAPSSMLSSGTIDGKSPVTLTTGVTPTIGGTFKSGYTINNTGTTTTTVAYTLPAAAAGLGPYCIREAATNTGALTIQTSGTGQYIDNAGGYTASGGYVISGGALGDAACIVAIDSTHWQLWISSGTWTTH